MFRRDARMDAERVCLGVAGIGGWWRKGSRKIGIEYEFLKTMGGCASARRGIRGAIVSGKDVSRK